MEYLEGAPLPADERMEREREDAAEGEEEAEEADTPCAKKPCGGNAVCWNSGSRFMCTCDHDHPHGNPYLIAFIALKPAYEKGVIAASDPPTRAMSASPYLRGAGGGRDAAVHTAVSNEQRAAER